MDGGEFDGAGGRGGRFDEDRMRDVGGACFDIRTDVAAASWDTDFLPSFNDVVGILPALANGGKIAGGEMDK